MRSPLRAVALALLLFTCAVSAQDLDSVQFSGKITDSNGLAIAGASIIVTRTETGVERTITTDDTGRFLLVQLKPGTYNVKVSANGFGKREKTNLITVSGQNVQLDFQLAPAGVVAEEVVLADDEAPAVDTTRTVVGG